MSEKYFNKMKTYLISIVVVFEIGHLLWEYFTGGVLSHHLLNRSDMPAISNWWGIIILPLLAWFAVTRIKKRITFLSDTQHGDSKIPKEILAGFGGMLLVSLILSLAFKFGSDDIAMYVMLGVLLTALFLPVYRTESILGYVLGGVITFGPVIPLIIILIISAISAFSNLIIKPLLVKIGSYIKQFEKSAE